ncbi:MAG: pentapeptide repeat-containing protein [Myxococcota bacterium]
MDVPHRLQAEGVSALRADCERCAALCCTATAHGRSADFARDKPAGRPCRHLAGHRCSVHARLREVGYPACAAFDCFGAGQRLTPLLTPGADLVSAFQSALRLHELLWLLTEARGLPAAAPFASRLDAAFAETDALAGELDPPGVREHWLRVNALLSEVADAARGAGADRRGADLVGKDLRRTALRGACLRGAWLIGADLRGVDLARADLTGADLRGADLRGADLSGALFATPPQLAAARGDPTTRLPPGREAPATW